MPRKERVKLFAEELEALRSARRNCTLPIPTDKRFKQRVRGQAGRLIAKSGFDLEERDHVLLVCAIAYEYLFENRRPGRPRRFTDNNEFDLLESYSIYEVKLTGIRSKRIASVTNGLCHFDRVFEPYKTGKGPDQLRKRFERAWKRLKEGKMTRLDWRRERRRGSLLKALETRFGISLRIDGESCSRRPSPRGT